MKSNYAARVFYVVLAAGFVIGWFLNVYKLFVTSAPVAEWAAMEVVRVIGIFVAPLGAVLGYF